MSTKSISTDFYKLTGIKINNSSFLKMFNILEDDDKIKFINIFRSYQVNEQIFTDVLYYNTYEVDNEDFWEQISYKLYGITDLWWALCLMNNVQNPFEDLSAGNNLKILKKNYIPQLLTEIKSVSEK
jgi:hypothetical protein